jgi:hypothetical protein
VNKIIKWLKSLCVPTPLKAEEQAGARSFVPLSDAKLIQLAFQQEMAALFNEAGAGTTPPTPPMPIPTTATGIIDGKGFRNEIDGLEQRGSLRPGTGSLHPVAIEATAEATKLSEPSV